MGLRFETPTYAEAMDDFVDSVVDGLIALDPVIGEIPTRKAVHAGPTRNVTGPNPLDHEPFDVQQEIVLDNDVIRRGKLDEFAATVRHVGEGLKDQVAAHILERMREITEATGSSIDAGGRPLSHDMILDALEMVEIDFAEGGNPIMPRIVVSPRTAEIISRLELTPDHLNRLEEILRRKKAEHDAEKRTRRLPGTQRDAQKRSRRLPG